MKKKSNLFFNSTRFIKNITVQQKMNRFITEWETIGQSISRDYDHLLKLASALCQSKKISHENTGFTKILPSRIQTEISILSDFNPRYIEARIYYLKQLKSDLEDMIPETTSTIRCKKNCEALIQEFENFHQPYFTSKYYNEKENDAELNTVKRDSVYSHNSP